MNVREFFNKDWNPYNPQGALARRPKWQQVLVAVACVLPFALILAILVAVTPLDWAWSDESPPRCSEANPCNVNLSGGPANRTDQVHDAFVSNHLTHVRMHYSPAVKNWLLDRAKAKWIATHPPHGKVIDPWPGDAVMWDHFLNDHQGDMCAGQLLNNNTFTCVPVQHPNNMWGCSDNGAYTDCSFTEVPNNSDYNTKMFICGLEFVPVVVAAPVTVGPAALFGPLWGGLMCGISFAVN